MAPEGKAGKKIKNYLERWANSYYIQKTNERKGRS
jgi:hypothetical protein